MVLVVTVHGTYFIVAVIRTAAVEAFVASGVALEVTLLTGGSTVSMHFWC